MDMRLTVHDFAGTAHFHRLFVLGEQVAAGIALRHVAEASGADRADKRDDRAVLDAVRLHLLCDGRKHFLPWLDVDNEHVRLLCFEVLSTYSAGRCPPGRCQWRVGSLGSVLRARHVAIPA